MVGQWANGAINPGQLFGPLQMYFSALESVAQNASPMMAPAKAMARCQLEAIGFTSRRAQAYMEIPSRLSRCRTPQDLVNEQVRFWQTAFQQYSETSKRMMDAFMQAAPMNVAGTGRERNARDYITFNDPREANGQSRTQRDRHAA